jgi:hypothetical protein
MDRQAIYPCQRSADQGEWILQQNAGGLIAERLWPSQQSWWPIRSNQSQFNKGVRAKKRENALRLGGMRRLSRKQTVSSSVKPADPRSQRRFMVRASRRQIRRIDSYWHEPWRLDPDRLRYLAPPAVSSPRTTPCRRRIYSHPFDLATLARNTVSTALNPAHEFVVHTRPTKLQQKALDLLAINPATCTQ